MTDAIQKVFSSASHTSEKQNGLSGRNNSKDVLGLKVGCRFNTLNLSAVFADS